MVNLHVFVFSVTHDSYFSFEENQLECILILYFLLFFTQKTYEQGLLPFYGEVSAKTGMNIESIIELLVKEILHQQNKLLGSIWEPDLMQVLYNDISYFRWILISRLSFGEMSSKLKIPILDCQK